MILRVLSAFMDAREYYLASLGAQYGITRDSAPPGHALAPQRPRARTSLRPQGLMPYHARIGRAPPRTSSNLRARAASVD
jgi:hypothetical protein